MTPEERQAIRERVNKATSGPWEVKFDSVWGQSRTIAACFGHGSAMRKNLDFMSHAREDVPKLLDEVEEQERNFIALEKSYERMREALRQIAESSDKWYVGMIPHQDIARKALEWRGEPT